MNGILKRKVFFVRIRFTSPLSISSGEDEWTDSDILKDCDGTPFVPLQEVCVLIWKKRKTHLVCWDIRTEKIQEK